MKKDCNVHDIRIPGYRLKEYETYKDSHSGRTKFVFHHRFLRSLRMFEIVWTETSKQDNLYSTFNTYSFIYGDEISKKNDEILCHVKENIKNNPKHRLSYLLGNKILHTSSTTEEESFEDFLVKYGMFIFPSLIGIFNFSLLFFFTKENIHLCLFSGIISSFAISVSISGVITYFRNLSEKKEIRRAYFMTFLFSCLLAIFLIL